MAVKYEDKCKTFCVLLSNSVYSTEYEVKGKSGRTLLISLSYPSSEAGLEGSGLAGRVPHSIAGVVGGNLDPAGGCGGFVWRLTQTAQSTGGSGSPRKMTLAPRSRDSQGPKLLPRTFWKIDIS